MTKAKQIVGGDIGRQVALLMVGLLGISIVTACDPTTPPKTAPAADMTVVAEDAAKPDATQALAPIAPPAITFAEGPAPTPDTVLIKGDGVNVTLADYEKSLQISRLMQPGSPQTLDPIPPDRLALPASQFTMARGILIRKAVARELAKRKIKVTDKQAIAWLANDPQFGKYGKIWGTPELEKILTTVGLEAADVLAIGREEVGRKKLAKQLVDEITDDEVWQRYAYEMTSVKIVVAMAMNVPSPSELSKFVEAKGPEIEAYFKENARTFRVPKKVKVDLLAAADGQEADEATLQKAQSLLASGRQAPDVAKQTGLELREGVKMVQQENGEAFRGQIGSTGHTMKGPRGAYTWIVRGFYQSYVPELDRGLRRQVAAEMMRREGLTPDNKTKLMEVRKAFAKIGDGSKPARLKAAERAATDLKLQYDVVGPFNKSPNGSMPVFGLATEVVEGAFALTDKKRTPKEPIFSRERGFMIHLLERTNASKKTFNQDKKAFVDRYKAEAMSTIVERYVQAQMAEEQPVFDLNPLSIKYGTVVKER